MHHSVENLSGVDLRYVDLCNGSLNQPSLQKDGQALQMRFIARATITDSKLPHLRVLLQLHDSEVFIHMHIK